ncbi:MAG: inositol monophosphatase [Verrucomicrobiales bacterium]|nr:inositol monophosphatase [Verrucomicrobiales bacterium]
MTKLSHSAALAASVTAARKAGALMRKNQLLIKKIDSATQMDIKLELDVRCQKLIEASLRRFAPEVAILGEEGTSGEANAAYRWVIDPIDGTVNFTYGIPHACVSIALERRVPAPRGRRSPVVEPGYETVTGLVYDPFCDELFTAIRGQTARLNGQPIHVSKRGRLNEAIISLGFSKEPESMSRMMPTFTSLLPQIRKVRIMGAAALAMVYVASGRMDAYLEYGLSWWDVAAGGLILECAGGDFWRRPLAKDHTCEILASNGLLRKKLLPYY